MNRQQAIQFALDQLDQNSDPRLKYHNPAHTRMVLADAEKIARSCNAEAEMDLILVAVAYHDIGFLRTTKSHEVASCQSAAEKLPEFGFGLEEIKKIEAIIMATKLPQSPKTKAEMIVCDADLAYLGGDDYDTIANQLYTELLNLGVFNAHTDWRQIQIDFLETHYYHTEYAIQELGPGKQKNLERLKNQ